MPLFMDIHTLEGGVSAADVAGAHQKDLETQGKYGVSYLRYWVDEDANTVHQEAHGLVADEIYPVGEYS